MVAPSQVLNLENYCCCGCFQVAEVKENELFRVECVEGWTGGLIKDDDSAEDIKYVDLNLVR